MRIKEKIRSTRFAGGRKYPEAELQECFADWLDDRGFLFNASCSGMKASPKAMKKMKKTGAKNGFPDVQIFEPNRRYHGMFIELKSKGGKATEEQKVWRDCLNYKGYYAVIMPTNLDWDDALQWLKKQVKTYMGLKR